ncbi:3-oxoacyl-[acyl-carrier-protein] reductase [bacterium]|nr:3-oxoacyl-[acyl-carrier-protein] reductase [bacterium]
MFNLENKVAIVSGASRGIGKVIAEETAKAGAKVVCVSRSLSDVEKIANTINEQGFTAIAMACDITNGEQYQEIVKSVIEKYGSIDILINNAGVTKDNLIMRMSENDWDVVIDTNLKGAFNGTKAVTRQMMKQRSGRIINISSVVGLIGNAGQANYAASKAGLIGLTKATAKELASRGITANCIAPGYIETDMTNRLPEKIKNTLVEQIPLGRIGKATDIAATVCFLASDEAGYITGQTFTVDGGMVMS